MDRHIKFTHIYLLLSSSDVVIIVVSVAVDDDADSPVLFCEKEVGYWRWSAKE